MGCINDLAGVAAPSIEAFGQYLCWTRMQAEAGQDLARIIARKEAERVAGEGLFFWGVGNAPSSLIPSLAKCGVEVPIVFSVMKSRPKRSDVAPSGVVVWNGYVDARGVERPVPNHALVLSRRDSPSGPKKAHYALMCFSAEPLTISRGEPFDHHAFCNASGRGAPVGASQVTALLKPSGTEELAAEYEANMRATLADSYWVRLTSPVELDDPEAIPQPDPSSWVDAVAELRKVRESTPTAYSSKLL